MSCIILLTIDDIAGASQSRGYTAERIFPDLRFDQITAIDSQPYPAAASVRGDRLFVLEKAGRIRVFDNTASNDRSDVFLDIRDRVTDIGSEQGLLGLAFHPDFEDNGWFYVHYTVATNRIPRRIHIARFTVPDQEAAPNVADPDSEQIILMVDQAAEGPPASSHNGGALAFSPINGLLHMTAGDGGGANDPNGNGQNPATLSGTVLRIDVDTPSNGHNYAIPTDNPFANQADVRGEVFAYGLRNPLKISFDENGDLWIGDVGEAYREEVNRVAFGDNSGPNFGWACREGSLAASASATACDDRDSSDFTAPMADYNLAGSQSITGGFVYRGREFAGLSGHYVYGDFVSGQVWAYDPADGSTTLIADTDLNIATFGRDAAGELYIGDFASGGLYRLVVN